MGSNSMQGDNQKSAGHTPHWVKVLLWACLVGVVLLVIGSALGA
jgi:hypothetical protein